MGGIPSIGGGSGKRALDAEMATAEVAVINYFVNSTQAVMVVRNNKPEMITLDRISIDRTPCTFIHSDELPVQLRPGQSRTITCEGSFVDHSRGSTAPSIGFRFRDLSVGANYGTSRYDPWCDPEWGVVLPFDGNLCWQRNASSYLEYKSPTINWTDAMDYCQGLTLGGRN